MQAIRSRLPALVRPRTHDPGLLALLLPELPPPASMRTQRVVSRNGSVAPDTAELVGRHVLSGHPQVLDSHSCFVKLCGRHNGTRLVCRPVRGVCGLSVEICVEDRVESFVESLVDNLSRAAAVTTLRGCGNDSRQAHAMTAALRLCDVRSGAVRSRGATRPCQSDESMSGEMGSRGDPTSMHA